MFCAALGPQMCHASAHCFSVSPVRVKSPIGTTGISGPKCMKWGDFVRDIALFQWATA